MSDPVAAASRFPGFPAWVLLEPFPSFGEWRNHTTATSLTSTKRTVEVSFELVDPPRVSRWFVRWVGPKKKQKRGFYGKPSIVNSSGSFVLMRMSFYRDDVDRILDYFVYKAGPGKPSLDLIPGPCPTVNYRHLIGILPSDDGEHYSIVFPIPWLDGVYKIQVFSSVGQSWSTKSGIICPDSKTTNHDLVGHHPSMAIATGRGSLAWIDLWKGVLLCDGLDEDSPPVLRLIKWPVPLHFCSTLDDYFDSPGATWDGTLSDGAIRFVEMKFHYSGGGCCHSIPIGWTATMWKRRCSLKEWKWESFEVDIAKILTDHPSSSDLLRKVWDTKSNKLDFSKLSKAVSILSLTNEDIVYFCINLLSSDKALMIAINARKKTLETVEETSFEWFCSPCSFS